MAKGLYHGDGPFRIGPSGTEKTSYPSKALSYRDGLLPRGNFFGHGPGIIRISNIKFGPSLKVVYQGDASWASPMDSNSRESDKGMHLKGEMYSGHVRSRFLVGQLAKIKPKIASSFAHGNISSSQNPIHAGKGINR